MEPGIYPNVPFPAYLSWPEPSQSTLKAGTQSMAHLRAALEGERCIEPTDDMVLGSALHVAFLEPGSLTDRVVCWTGGARRGKEWEAFKAEHAHRYILTENQHEKMIGMVASLRAHPFVREWSAKMEGVEVAAVGDVYGLKMKGRCDALTPEPLVDLKKVRNGDPRAFTRAVFDYGYHIQAAIYRRLFNRDRFVFVTVEDEPPFDVVPYELAPAWIRQGEREAEALILGLLHCRATGVWPGRSTEIVTLEVPDWAVAESETGVMLGGEAV